MENASKALIMAASVLLGVMIISVGVALFNSFSDFGTETTEKLEEKQISEFNNNFLKYYGKITTTDGNQEIEESIKVTVHDIISVANLAKTNNEQYELEDQEEYNENTYYIQVNFKNIQLEIKDEEYYKQFLKDNILENNETKYFICSKVEISSVTKRVMYVVFDDYE